MSEAARAAIDETGTLIRDGGGFFLQRDAGGRYALHLRRLPVDHLAKRVRVVGTLVDEETVMADGIGAA